MDEKIYCSQCHNSAFVGTNKPCTPSYFREMGHTKCLYCFVFKRFFAYNVGIKEFGNICPFGVPENVEKLRTGIWNARTEWLAIKDYMKHNRVKEKEAKRK